MSIGLMSKYILKQTSIRNLPCLINLSPKMYNTYLVVFEKSHPFLFLTDISELRCTLATKRNRKKSLKQRFIGPIRISYYFNIKLKFISSP